jgi:hypothetical protein
MCGFFKIWSAQYKVKGEMEVVLNGKIGSGKKNIFEETGKAAKDKKQKRRGKKDMCKNQRCGTGTVGTVTFLLVEPEPEP